MVAMEYHLPMIFPRGNVLVAHRAILPLSGWQLIAGSFWSYCEGGGAGGGGGGCGGGGGGGGVWNMTVLLHSV